MRVINVLKHAAAFLMVAASAVDAAQITQNSKFVTIVVASQWSRTAVRVLQDNGVAAWHAISSQVYADLSSRFGGGAWGNGLMTGCRYTDGNVREGLSGYWAINYEFPSSNDAANAVAQVAGYVASNWKRGDEEDIPYLRDLKAVEKTELPDSVWSPHLESLDDSSYIPRAKRDTECSSIDVDIRDSIVQGDPGATAFKYYDSC